MQIGKLQGTMFVSMGVLGLGSYSASAAIIGPAGTIPVSNPASVLDVSNPGNSYSLVGNTTVLPNGFDVRDLFGGSFGTNNYEHNDVIFTDNLPIGTVDSVSVTLPQPVSLTDFNLYLEEDSDGGRSASEFELYAGNTLIDDVHILDHTGTQTYNSVYGSDYIEIADTLANVPASTTYTLDFVQNQNSGSVSGVRAMEFEAVPEPTALPMLGIAALGLLARRRRMSNAV